MGTLGKRRKRITNEFTLEHDLQNVVMYGGIDALIWLCRSSTSVQIHYLATTILSTLAEKESIRPVIITKWALPPLLHLIEFYVYYDTNTKKKKNIKQQQQSIVDDDTPPDQEVILEIIINCSHVFYQLSRAGILSQSNIIDDGVLFTLLTLAAYDPAVERQLQVQQQEVMMENGNGSIDGRQSHGDEDEHDGTERNGTNHRAQEEREEEERHQQEQEQELAEQIKDRIRIIQSLASKAVSAISASVSNQPSVIELIRGTDKFAYLLRSTNGDVRKYMAKTIAYLSLRNGT